MLDHGRASTYNGRGCRCDLCRAAAVEDQRRRREIARGRVLDDPGPPVVTEWRPKAACLGTDTAGFFIDSKTGTISADIRDMCRRCKVRAECLAEGMHERFGFWGGYSVKDRQRLRAQRAMDDLRRSG